MSSGLAFDESYGTFSEAPRMLFGVTDAAQFGADHNLAHSPGTHWAYSSATTNMLSAVLKNSFENVTDYLEFPHKYLFRPLLMDSPIIQTDAANTMLLSSFMYASLRDWARFASLYARDGVSLDHQRLLPPNWVQEMVLQPAPASLYGEYSSQIWLPLQKPHPQARLELSVTYNPVVSACTGAMLFLGFHGQASAVLPCNDVVLVRFGLTEDPRDGQFDQLVQKVLHATTQSH
jgi:hypothetical protein